MLLRIPVSVFMKFVPTAALHSCFARANFVHRLLTGATGPIADSDATVEGSDGGTADAHVLSRLGSTDLRVRAARLYYGTAIKRFHKGDGTASAAV